MKLRCYLFPGWEPRIRAATSRRDWMDRAAESYPYRCLPLAIANSHGWDILSPCGFEAEWNGGLDVNDVVVRADAGTRAHEAPVALFGQGAFTIHVQALFRTDPGWNLWVSGPPNSAKDGAAPLAGIIETDWAPYTFTMNWKLTRPNFPVRFEENEVIAHIFPIRRDAIEATEPEFAPISADPELKAQFEAWSASRNAFQDKVRHDPPQKPADKWQKLYYRGLTPDGACPVAGHQSKLNVREFGNPSLAGNAPAAMKKPPGAIAERNSATRDIRGLEKRIEKYEWLMETQERYRQMSRAAGGVSLRESMASGEFLDQFYAPGRAVVLAGAVDDWPAFRKWSPAYLRGKIGNALVELQGNRRLPFDRFIDLAQTSPANDCCVTADNAVALKPLLDDLGHIDALLDHRAGGPDPMLRIGAAGTFAPLHQGHGNKLMVQLVGRQRILLASAQETPKLYDDAQVFSEIPDVTSLDIDLARHPRLKDVRLQEVILAAGDALFIPVGWWRQVAALDFSVSATYVNFRWPNPGWDRHPS